MTSAWAWVAGRYGECQGSLPASQGSGFCLPADAQAEEARAATGNGTLLGCGYQCGWEAQSHAARDSGDHGASRRAVLKGLEQATLEKAIPFPNHRLSLNIDMKLFIFPSKR